MPLLTTLAAIAAIAGAGISGGEAIHAGLQGTPQAPAAAPTTAPGPTPQQQQQTALQQKAAVGQQLPTLEGLTSGFANPEYYGQQGALAAGVAGQPGGNASAASAVEKAFGLPQGSLTGGGGTSAPKTFTPAGSGGTNQGAFPAGDSDLSSFVSTFFKG